MNRWLTRAGSFIPRAFLHPHLWLGAIVLLAFALRVYHLGAFAIWWDESLSYDRALHDLPTILANAITIQNIPSTDLHPPLYFLFLHFTVLAFGISEFALRFFSTFANVLTLPLLYLVGRQWSGRARVGVLAAFLGAVSPFYIWYAQEARPYALVLFWSLLAVYAVKRALGDDRRQTTDDRRQTVIPQPRWLVVYFFALAATLYTHYLSFVLLPFHAVLFLILALPRWRAWWLALAPALAFVIALPLLPNTSALLAGSETGGPQFVPFQIILRDLLNSFSVGLTADFAEAQTFDYVLLAIFFWGVIASIRTRPGLHAWHLTDLQTPLFLLAFAFLPPLTLQLGSYVRPLYMNSRHLITISPAFYLGLAFGIAGLARRWWGLAVAALAIYLVGVGGSLNNLYFNPQYAKDDHRGWASYLRENARQDDFLILVTPHASTVYQYYAPSWLQWSSLPHLGLPEDEQARQDFSAVQDALRVYPRVWFLELHAPVGDPNRHIDNLMRRFGYRIDRVFSRGMSTEIVLSLFESNRPYLNKMPEMQHALDVEITPEVEMLGYDAPSELAVGGRGVVNLYWIVNDNAPEDYGVTLRIVDDQGVVWGQRDGIPYGKLYRTRKWPLGKVMKIDRDLEADPGAPPGKYHVELIVYRGQTGESILDPIRLNDLTLVRPRVPVNPNEIFLDQRGNADFGGAVRWLGYIQPVDSIKPGEKLPLYLYFQLRSAPQSDLVGTVRLVQPIIPIINFAPGTSRGDARFTIPVVGRVAGDIVRAQVNLPVAGDTAPGEDVLTLMLEGQPPRVFGLPLPELVIGVTRVESISRASAPPPIEHPLNARLGDGVDFLGYDLSAPDPLQPGDTIELTLYWRARQTMSTSYTVFTHLLGADNQLSGQSDSVPMRGERPTTSWAPGEIISDRYEIVVKDDTPPGDYQIEIGMYDAQTGARLPTYDAEGQATGDRILFEDLTVQ